MVLNREIEEQLNNIARSEATARQKEIDAENQKLTVQREKESRIAEYKRLTEENSLLTRSILEGIIIDSRALELLQEVRQKWGVGELSWDYRDYNTRKGYSETHEGNEELHLVLSYTYPDVEDRGSTYYPADAGGDGLGGPESWGPPDYYIGSSTTSLEIVAKRYTYDTPDKYVLEVHDDGTDWNKDDHNLGIGLVIDVNPLDAQGQQDALRHQVAGYTAKRIHENKLPLQMEQTARENIHNLVPFKRRFGKGF